MRSPPDITLLLEKAHRGDREALNAVARVVHSGLLRQARGLLTRRAAGAGGSITLEPAELVNETFLKLLQQRRQFRNRRHFFAVATTVMLRVLLDYHKARMRQKRAAKRVRISLGALGAAHAVEPSTEIPDLVAALEELERLDPRAAQILKLRVLWGLSVKEIGEVVGVSRSTVDRDWLFARTWLAANL
jgi:RNA polymerase sigma factor (TIGR02999 family)